MSVLYFRIAGDTALDKNIHESVSAQIKKNFAKSKWKVNQCIYESERTSSENVNEVLQLKSMVYDFNGCLSLAIIHSKHLMPQQ